MDLTTSGVQGTVSASCPTRDMVISGAEKAGSVT